MGQKYKLNNIIKKQIRQIENVRPSVRQLVSTSKTQYHKIKKKVETSLDFKTLK